MRISSQRLAARLQCPYTFIYLHFGYHFVIQLFEGGSPNSRYEATWPLNDFRIRPSV